jgi:hypothetical protein
MKQHSKKTSLMTQKINKGPVTKGKSKYVVERPLFAPDTSSSMSSHTPNSLPPSAQSSGFTQ